MMTYQLVLAIAAAALLHVAIAGRAYRIISVSTYDALGGYDASIAFLLVLVSLCWPALLVLWPFKRLFSWTAKPRAKKFTNL